MTIGAHLKTGFVDGVQWVRAHGSNPRGLVFSPPLIGGHALQQIRMLRRLVHDGFDLISFNYAGHAESSGIFSFRASFDNCLAILDWSKTCSRKEKLALYGIASCFGALPLVHAAAQRNEPLNRLVLINAVPHWRWESLLMAFMKRWVRAGSGWLSLSGNRTAMQQYLSDLFPGVNHRKRSFGILSRKRMHWTKMAGELWIFRHREPAPLMKTPVLCAYGRRDRLLQQMGFTDWAWYESHILNICPHTRFLPLDSDHFLSSPSLRHGLLNTASFFFKSAATDRNATPMRSQ